MVPKCGHLLSFPQNNSLEVVTNDVMDLQKDQFDGRCTTGCIDGYMQIASLVKVLSLQSAGTGTVDNLPI